MKTTFVRLPDISSFADLSHYGYQSYGRFAILNDGSLWVGDLHSSHPRDTMVGWYWAISEREELLISARGARTQDELLTSPESTILHQLFLELKRRRII
jgi:hypothetical protein